MLLPPVEFPERLGVRPPIEKVQSLADEPPSELVERVDPHPRRNGRDVSAIIPVYNDPEGIRTTITALINQEYDCFEIIPVDNGSVDETGDVITELFSKRRDLIRPCDEVDVQSSYAARNTGIKHATGDVLLFLDADMWVEETWIGQMVDTMESRDCGYLGCNVDVVADEDPPFAERYERALSFPVETYLERKRFAPTCALAVRRTVFEKVGTFDERLVSGGDKEFGQRVHRAGFEQCYAGQITAYHPARDSFEELFSKARRIGRGRAQVRQYHSEMGNYPHPLSPINYLPPSPWRLGRRYSGVPVSFRSMAAFYLLEYALKLTQTASSLRETIALWRGD